MASNNNTPLRWSKDEEKKLLVSLSEGKSLDKIAAEHNRSTNATELRLKKIIYDNVSSGRSEESLSKITKIPLDKVKQYHYEYKGFLENKSKSIDDKLGISRIIEKHAGGSDPQPIKAKEESGIIVRQPEKIEKIEKIDDDALLKLHKYIKKIGKQNKILKRIAENAELREKIKTLAEQGKINKKILDYFKIK